MSLTDLLFLYHDRCTDDIPLSSASEEDRQTRADIAASFQVLHDRQCIQCLLFTKNFDICPDNFDLCSELLCYIWKKDANEQLNGH
jgi:hypothetical protein